MYNLHLPTFEETNAISPNQRRIWANLMALKLKYLTQPILAHFTSNTQQKIEPNKNETGSMGGHLKSSRVQKFHFWKSLQRSRLRMFTLKASERLWVVGIALIINTGESVYF